MVLAVFLYVGYVRIRNQLSKLIHILRINCINRFYPQATCGYERYLLLTLLLDRHDFVLFNQNAINYIYVVKCSIQHLPLRIWRSCRGFRGRGAAPGPRAEKTRTGAPRC